MSAAIDFKAIKVKVENSFFASLGSIRKGLDHAVSAYLTTEFEPDPAATRAALRNHIDDLVESARHHMGRIEAELESVEKRMTVLTRLERAR